MAPVGEPELVARTVAAVLQVREEPGRLILDTLVDAVGDRCLLVVLDNAEHVLGAVAKLADTVRSRLDRIRDKTGARRRPDLVRYALQAGIEGIAPSP